MPDIADIAERHRPVRSWLREPDAEPVRFDICEHDGLAWPCEVRLVLDDRDGLLDRLLATIGRERALPLGEEPHGQ